MTVVHQPAEVLRRRALNARVVQQHTFVCRKGQTQIHARFDALRALRRVGSDLHAAIEVDRIPVGHWQSTGLQAKPEVAELPVTISPDDNEPEAFEAAAALAAA